MSQSTKPETLLSVDPDQQLIARKSHESEALCFICLLCGSQSPGKGSMQDLTDLLKSIGWFRSKTVGMDEKRWICNNCRFRKAVLMS